MGRHSRYAARVNEQTATSVPDLQKSLKSAWNRARRICQNKVGIASPPAAPVNGVGGSGLNGNLQPVLNSKITASFNKENRAEVSQPSDETTVYAQSCIEEMFIIDIVLKFVVAAGVVVFGKCFGCCCDKVGKSSEDDGDAYIKTTESEKVKHSDHVKNSSKVKRKVTRKEKVKAESAVEEYEIEAEPIVGSTMIDTDIPNVTNTLPSAEMCSTQLNISKISSNERWAVGPFMFSEMTVRDVALESALVSPDVMPDKAKMPNVSHGRLRFYRHYRYSSVTCKVRFNVNPFTSGYVRLAFFPHIYKDGDMVPNNNKYNLASCSWIQHVDLDLQRGDSLELTVPWYYNRDWFTLDDADDFEGYNIFGYFAVIQIVPPSSGESGSKVTYRPSVTFSDVEFAGSRPFYNVTAQADVKIYDVMESSLDAESLDVSDLASEWQIYNIYEWKETNSNESIVRFPVTPFTLSQLTTNYSEGTGTIVHVDRPDSRIITSPIGHLILMHDRWRGDMEFRITPVCTNFHKGTYAAYHMMSTSVLSDNTSANLATFPSVIGKVGAESQPTIVSVPFYSDTFYKEVSIIPNVSGQNCTVETGDLGYIGIAQVNKLTCPSTVDQSVRFLVEYRFTKLEVTRPVDRNYIDLADSYGEVVERTTIVYGQAELEIYDYAAGPSLTGNTKSMYDIMALPREEDGLDASGKNENFCYDRLYVHTTKMFVHVQERPIVGYCPDTLAQYVIFAGPSKIPIYVNSINSPVAARRLPFLRTLTRYGPTEYEMASARCPAFHKFRIRDAQTKFFGRRAFQHIAYAPADPNGKPN